MIMWKIGWLYFIRYHSVCEWWTIVESGALKKHEQYRVGGQKKVHFTKLQTIVFQQTLNVAIKKH